jgi:hypothetical protein
MHRTALEVICFRLAPGAGLTAGVDGAVREMRRVSAVFRPIRLRRTQPMLCAIVSLAQELGVIAKHLARADRTECDC